MRAVVYVHGRGGSASESGHYKALFPACDVIGLDYKDAAPWEAGREINKAIKEIKASCDGVILIANSIGAFFAMNADIEGDVEHAYFISPIVDMEKLIRDMMAGAGVTETELRERKIIRTDLGEDLSWEYLRYVREHPARWRAPTDILYGSGDHLTPADTMTAFAREHHASLTVMENGEHWFHTDEQMQFLDNWLREKTDSHALGLDYKKTL